MKRFQSIDGRWITVLILFGYLLVLLAGKSIFHQTYDSTLKVLGVPSIPPHFGDLHFVVASSASLRAGFDPMVKNPYDVPAHQPFNYPPFWLYVGSLGLSQGNYRGVGAVMDLLFLAGTLYWVGRIDRWGGVYLGLFLISPAIVLCLERANVDLLMYFLIVGAFCLRRYLFAAIPLIVLGGILKLFPIFALPAFAQAPWKKNLSWLIGGGLFFLAYVCVFARDIGFVLKNTGRLYYHSFGTAVLTIRFSDWHHIISIHQTIMGVVTSLFFLGIILAALRWAPRFEPQGDLSAEIMAFRLGAFLFLGIFAIGANFDYKFIFITFCLPLLFRLRHGTQAIHRWAQAALLLLLIYVGWFAFFGEVKFVPFFVRQVISWGIAGSVAVLMATTQTWPPFLKWKPISRSAT